MKQSFATVSALTLVPFLFPPVSFAAQPTTGATSSELFASASTDSGDADYAGMTNGYVKVRTARFSGIYRDSFCENLNYHAGAGFTRLTPTPTAACRCGPSAIDLCRSRCPVEIHPHMESREIRVGADVRRQFSSRVRFQLEAGRRSHGGSSISIAR